MEPSPLTYSEYMADGVDIITTPWLLKQFFNRTLENVDTVTAEELVQAAKADTRLCNTVSLGEPLIFFLAKMALIHHQYFPIYPSEKFDVPKLINRFKFRSIYSLITTFELDRKQIQDSIVNAKAELISYRIFHRKKCRYDSMLNILRRNYKSWLRCFQRDYFHKLHEVYHISIKFPHQTTHSFSINEICGQRLLAFRQRFSLNICDKKKQCLVTISSVVNATAECSDAFNDTRTRFALEFTDLDSNIDCSDDRHEDLCNRFFSDLKNWSSTASRLKEQAREGLLIQSTTMSAQKFRDHFSPQVQRKNKGLKTSRNRARSGTSKGRKSSWDRVQLDRSSSLKELIKSPRIRSPRKSSKSPSDLSKDVQELHPSLIHSLVSGFCFEDLDDSRLSRICQLETAELLDMPEFSTHMGAPPTLRRFLGSDHLFIQKEDKPFHLLKRVFGQIYHAGYCDHIVKSGFTEKTVSMMAELQAYRFLDKKDDPIQQFLYPMMESFLRVRRLYRELFPYMNQRPTRDSSDFAIKSEWLKQEPTVKIDGEHLERDFTIHLVSLPKKQRIADLILCESLSKLETGERRRFLTIKSLTFVRGTSLDVVDYVIKRMKCSAEEWGCLRKSK